VLRLWTLKERKDHKANQVRGKKKAEIVAERKERTQRGGAVRHRWGKREFSEKEGKKY